MSAIYLNKENQRINPENNFLDNSLYLNQKVTDAKLQSYLRLQLRNSDKEIRPPCYAECDIHCNHDHNYHYEYLNSNNNDKEEYKYINIVEGNKYKIKYYSQGRIIEGICIVKSINVDNNDSINGYINIYLTIENNFPISCSVYISTILDIVELDDNEEQQKPSKEDVKIVILGISSTLLRSIVIRLGLIDDDPDKGTTYVDMKVGNRYNITYDKRNTIYELSGKLICIKELCNPLTENQDKQFVRQTCGCEDNNYYDPNYDSEFRQPPECIGMHDKVYDSCCNDANHFLISDKNVFGREVELLFDTGVDGYPCYEKILLSSIRFCCDNNACTNPSVPGQPPFIPDNNTEFKYNISDYTLTFTGKNISKVILLKGIVEDDAFDINNVVETICDIYDNTEYTINIPSNGDYTISVYYKCICPVKFIPFTVTSSSTHISSESDVNHCYPDYDISISVDEFNNINIYANRSRLIVNIFKAEKEFPINTPNDFMQYILLGKTFECVYENITQYASNVSNNTNITTVLDAGNYFITITEDICGNLNMKSIHQLTINPNSNSKDIKVAKEISNYLNSLNCKTKMECKGSNTNIFIIENNICESTQLFDTYDLDKNILKKLSDIFFNNYLKIYIGNKSIDLTDKLHSVFKSSRTPSDARVLFNFIKTNFQELKYDEELNKYYISIQFLYSTDKESPLAENFFINIYMDSNENVITNIFNLFDSNFNRTEKDGLYVLEINHKPVNLLLDSMSNSDIKSMKVSDYLDLIADNITSDEFKDKSTGFDLFEFIKNNTNIITYFSDNIFGQNKVVMISGEPVQVFNCTFPLYCPCIYFNSYTGEDYWTYFVNTIKSALTRQFLDLYLSDIDSSTEDSRDIIISIYDNSNTEQIHCQVKINLSDLY